MSPTTPSDPPVPVAELGSVIQWVNVDSEVHASTSITPTCSTSVGGITKLAHRDAWDSGLLDSDASYKQGVDKEKS